MVPPSCAEETPGQSCSSGFGFAGVCPLPYSYILGAKGPVWMVRLSATSSIVHSLPVEMQHGPWVICVPQSCFSKGGSGTAAGECAPSLHQNPCLTLPSLHRPPVDMEASSLGRTHILPTLPQESRRAHGPAGMQALWPREQPGAWQLVIKSSGSDCPRRWLRGCGFNRVVPWGLGQPPVGPLPRPQLAL